MKECIKCNNKKEIKEFSKDKSKKDGLDTRCRLCRRSYRAINKGKAKEYREANKLRLKFYAREYYKKNRTYLNENAKTYQKNNKANANIRKKKRRKSDNTYKLVMYLRSRMWHVLKHNSKSKNTIQLLGCPGLQFKEYLQKGFTKRMTWGNYGTYWHVDHIRPLASFDLSNPEEQQKAFHFSNCQPLEAKKNMQKSDKWDGQVNLFLV